ncbi:MAG: porin [Ottowia sp.]|nr:porin [Ottowia sp.]
MNNAPSRIGFTGVEDLGNGNKVGFQFEAGLNLEDGSPDDPFWQRNANVFIGGNWGTIKLGRQLTVSHITEGAYDLTGLANYSVMRNTYKVNGFVPRASDAIAYISPNFGGFTVAAAFVSKNDVEKQLIAAGGTGAGAKAVWDVGMMYANGPISVGAAVNNGLDNGKKNYHVGAKYSFGNFAVAASYHNGSSNANDWTVYDIYGNAVGVRESLRRGFSLGGQAKFGAFTATLDVTRDTKNEWTGRWGWNPMLAQWEWNNKKFTNVLLEGKYALSKRTFFYGAVLRLDGYTNWGLGLSHSF